jgi:hypothetical protein
MLEVKTKQIDQEERARRSSGLKSVLFRQNLSAIPLNSQGAKRRIVQEIVLWIQIRIDPHLFGCPG